MRFSPLIFYVELPNKSNLHKITAFYKLDPANIQKAEQVKELLQCKVPGFDASQINENLGTIKCTNLNVHTQPYIVLCMLVKQ